MLSQTAEYALYAITWLTLHPESAQTTEQIATGMKIPPDYLSKVLQQLKKEKLVVSQRGLKGGFSLARDPSRITPLDIIMAIDPINEFETCPLGLKAHEHKLCSIHTKLNEAITMAKVAFDSSSMKELCSEE
ncbi:MAG: Rrf2 family transcriptional regulator [Planctomycetota bacterium]